MPFIRELADVMLDTEEFFRRIKRWGVKRGLGYFAFISLISLLINWLLLANNITPAGVIPFEKVIFGQMVFYIPLAYFIIGFLFMLLNSLLISTILGRMDFKISRKETVKVMSYSFTPSILTLWIPVLGVFLLIWSVYLAIMGLGVYNGAPMKKNAKACIAGGIITAIFLVLFMLGAGWYMITTQGLNTNLIWSVLLPL